MDFSEERVTVRYTELSSCHDTRSMQLKPVMARSPGVEKDRRMLRRSPLTKLVHWLGNLGLKAKMLFWGVVPLFLVASVAGYGLSIVQSMADHAQMGSETYRVVHKAMTVNTLVLETRMAWQEYLRTKDGTTLLNYQDTLKHVDREFSELKDLVARDRSQVNRVEAMLKGVEDWQSNVAGPAIRQAETTTDGKRTETAAAGTLTGKDKTFQNNFRQEMSSFLNNEQNKLLVHSAEAQRANRVVHNFVYIGVIVFFLLVGGSSYYMARSITKALSEALALAEAVDVEGDLSRRIEVNRRDEIGRLCKALNDMADGLQKQTGQIREAVDVMGAASSEITVTAGQLSASSTVISSAVTETSTTIEQVKQSAKIAAEKAKSVAKASGRVTEISESGRIATGVTSEKMDLIRLQMRSIGTTVEKLSGRSRAVDEIIGTVKDLAAQSNLLAVNASIEAARAGDQGKGFAVVANEIKTLADESKEATDQVRTILGDMREGVDEVASAVQQGGQAVDDGVEQSVAAGESIQALAKSISGASQTTAVISTMNEQQFSGVAQVTDAMASIRQEMLQNVEGLSRLEEAARQLESIGGSLKDLVERYRV